MTEIRIPLYIDVENLVNRGVCKEKLVVSLHDFGEHNPSPVKMFYSGRGETKAVVLEAHTDTDDEHTLTIIGAIPITDFYYKQILPLFEAAEVQNENRTNNE